MTFKKEDQLIKESLMFSEAHKDQLDSGRNPADGALKSLVILQEGFRSNSVTVKQNKE